MMMAKKCRFVFVLVLMQLVAPVAAQEPTTFPTTTPTAAETTIAPTFLPTVGPSSAGNPTTNPTSDPTSDNKETPCTICPGGESVPLPDAIAYEFGVMVGSNLIAMEWSCTLLQDAIAAAETEEGTGCNSAVYDLGVAKCGCPETRPPAQCTVCQDGSFPSLASVFLGSNSSCSSWMGLMREEEDEEVCDSFQKFAAPYCGCNYTDTGSGNEVCRLCGEDNLLPDPSTDDCGMLELDANLDKDICVEHRDSFGDVCCSVPPTVSPTTTQPPSVALTSPPSTAPTGSPVSTGAPSQSPSIALSPPPSTAPTGSPVSTSAPSQPPSIAPDLLPSIAPTLPPSIAPSPPPTIAPSLSTSMPPSPSPTIAPNLSTSSPPSPSPVIVLPGNCKLCPGGDLPDPTLFIVDEGRDCGMLELEANLGFSPCQVYRDKYSDECCAPTVIAAPSESNTPSLSPAPSGVTLTPSESATPSISPAPSQSMEPSISPDATAATSPPSVAPISPTSSSKVPSTEVPSETELMAGTVQPSFEPGPATPTTLPTTLPTTFPTTFPTADPASPVEPSSSAQPSSVPGVLGPVSVPPFGGPISVPPFGGALPTLPVDIESFEPSTSPSDPTQDSPTSPPQGYFPPQVEQMPCGMLCLDGSPAPNPDVIAFVEADLQITCGQLEDLLASNNSLFTIDCEVAAYIGVNACGCNSTLPEPNCTLCEDGSAVPHVARIIDMESGTCAHIDVKSVAQIVQEDSCQAYQATAGVYCGCNNTNSSAGACRICGGDMLLPDPSIIADTSTNLSCLALEFNTNDDQGSTCQAYQELYGPACCSTPAPVQPTAAPTPGNSTPSAAPTSKSESRFLGRTVLSLFVGLVVVLL